MVSKMFARVAGLVYLVVGACAFLPVAALNGGPSPNTVADTHVGLHFSNLFNAMPMNYLLAGILLGFGVSGLWTSFDTRASRLWCRALFLTSVGFVIIGLCPQPLARGFGLLPLYGWTDGFFLITGLFSFYGAFMEGPLPAIVSDPVFRA